jgi:putative DNA primase/helicase
VHLVHNISPRDDRRHGEVDQLYPNYIHYCETTGHHPLSQQRFSHVLLDLCESLGYEVKRIRKAEGWMFKGLTLKRGLYTAPLPPW